MEYGNGTGVCESRLGGCECVGQVKVGSEVRAVGGEGVGLYLWGMLGERKDPECGYFW